MLWLRYTFLLAGLLCSTLHAQDLDYKEALRLSKEHKDSIELSMSYAEQALKGATEHGDEKAIAKANFRLARGYFFSGRYAPAKEHYQVFLSADLALRDSVETEDANFYMAVMAMMEKDWTGALPHLLIAVDYALASGDHYNLPDAYNMLGSIYTHIAPKDFKRAVGYHRLALAEWVEIDNLPGFGRTYSFIGEAFAEALEYDSAMVAYRHALAFFNRAEHPTGQGIAHMNIGNTHCYLGHWDSAAVFLEKSLEYLDRDNNYAHNQALYAQSLVTLAEAKLNLGEISQADARLNEYLSMKDEILSDFSYMEFYRVRSLLRQAQGDHQGAYEDLELSSNIRDSVYAEETALHVLGLMELYQSETKDREIAEQKSQITSARLAESNARAKKKEEEAEKWVVIRIAILLVVVIVFVTLWFRQKRRADRGEKQLLAERLQREEAEAVKLREELAFRAQSLSAYSLLVAQKNEIIQGLDELVKNNRADIPVAQEMTSLIRSGKSFEDEWDQFRALFDEVHPGFSDKIRQSFPDLTANEVRLCALLKMNLSSKQIASILNIEPRSVDVGRSRMRKKMGLDSSTSLTDFIMKF